MKLYIGDSVYAEHDIAGDRIILTTENGYGPVDTIYLDREVIVALNQVSIRFGFIKEKADDSSR